MGGQIGLLLAVRGHVVTIVDQDAAALERCRARQRGDLTRFPAGPGPDDRLAAVTYARSLDSGALDADLVIEAVTEDLGVKRSLFREPDAATKARTVLTTNSSSLRAAQLTEGLRHPERMLNLHFRGDPAAGGRRPGRLAPNISK